ncbi:Uncharacterized protein OBRU01_12385 [Operophtera brumata]|uniref:SWIM-type domain-containing protein n=1 Tax=Operophtera brumata TaxID=104452 RepID=A0A0L7LAU7_OPEBR|nr:Uncharacterized protein OBRU01_12385 [Operophtera brumata]
MTSTQECSCLFSKVFKLPCRHILMLTTELKWLYDIDSGMLVSIQQSVQTALPTHTHAHHRAEGNQSVPAE